MIYPLKNKKGFVSVQMYLVILAMIGIVFSYAFLSFVAESKMQFRTKCTTETIELQKKIIQAEKTLFLLNPVSTALKYTRDGLVIAIGAAAALNPGIAASLTIKLNNVNKAREALDKSQKIIIHGANALIAAQTSRTVFEMNKTAYDTRSRWTYFLNSFIFAVPEGIPKMAVEPDSDDIAPNYGLTKGYKLEQMVAYKWHLFFFTKDDVQQVQKGTGLFELSCGATADKENKKWLVEIRKDKF